MSKFKYSFSIIIPVYNACKYLTDCLSSILAQDLTDYEVLCVDDGSTDNSLQILNEFAKNDSRIKVFSKNNGGVSSARNYVVPEIQGKYFTFVDADDILLDGALSYFIRTFEECDCDVFIEQYLACFEGSNYPNSLKREITKVLTAKEAVNYFLKSNMGGYACGKVYRTEIIRKLTFPESVSIMEDLYAFVRLFESDYTFCFSSSMHYGYRQHSESALRKISKIKCIDVLFVLGEILRIMNCFNFSLSEIRRVYERVIPSCYVNWRGYSELPYYERQRYKKCISVLTRYLVRNPCSLFMKLRVYVFNGRCEGIISFCEYLYYGMKKKLGSITKIMGSNGDNEKDAPQ